MQEINNLINKGILLEIESGSLITQLMPQTNNSESINERNRLFFEFYVYDINSNDLLDSKTIHVLDEWNNSIFVDASRLLLNPGIHLRSLGYSSGVYNIKYKFYKNIVGSHTEDKLHIKRISPSRTEIELIPPEGINNIIHRIIVPPASEHPTITISVSESLSGIRKDYVDFISNNNLINQLKTYLNFGSDKTDLIINSAHPEGFDLLLKLYNPLDSNVNDYDNCWICEELIPEYNDRIVLYTQKLPDLSNLKYLRHPDVNYNDAGIHYRTTPLENFETLITTDRNIQNEIIRYYLSSSLIEGIQLNTDYRKFENFIKFSSIQQRLMNFKRKIINIEFYESKINQYYTGSIGSASIVTPEISTSIDYFRNLKQTTINEFDNYERYLYYESKSYESSSIGEFEESTWPKYTSTKPYYLYSYTASQAQQWYSGQINSASIYDRQNKDLYSNFVPLDMQLDNENDDFVKFINMIGHYLDISNIYIKEIPSWHYKDNSIDEGIPKDLIIHAINHYGFDLRSGQTLKSLNSYIIETGSAEFSFNSSDSSYGSSYGSDYGSGL